MTDPIAAARTRGQLRFGCSLEQDNDGDWIICPPPDVTIFTEPGEGVLLAAQTEDEAYAEATDYLLGVPHHD